LLSHRRFRLCIEAGDPDYDKVNSIIPVNVIRDLALISLQSQFGGTIPKIASNPADRRPFNPGACFPWVYCLCRAKANLELLVFHQGFKSAWGKCTDLSEIRFRNRGRPTTPNWDDQ
jgi:hypothetical protein